VAVDRHRVDPFETREECGSAGNGRRGEPVGPVHVEPDANPVDGAQAYWGVANVEQAVERAIAHGAMAVSPATDVGDGIVTATVRTPSGSVVGFIFNPHFTHS
jgi:predicted enzyme related to lactoylglutathione lyase